MIDDAADEDKKEFFTINTPDENTFYLIIDKQRGGENVYFLNTVTESDLMALAEKDQDNSDMPTEPEPEPEPVCTCVDKCEAGAVNTACPVCVLSLRDCVGTTPVPVEEPVLEQPDKSNNFGTVLIVLLVILAVGGAGWYFKIYKPKKTLDDAEDFDDLADGEEEMVNEDDDDEPSYPGDDEEEET